VPTFGSLFTGIGGIDLGLERAGWTCKWQVEIDDFCKRVLERHWPDVARFRDVRDCHGAGAVHPNTPNGRRQRRGNGLRATRLREREATLLPNVDLITGGFPCQPVSHAGKRKGDADERWLWPEFARIIREVHPRWVLIENVPGLLSIDAGRLFRGVLWDLAESGYDAEWFVLSAADVGAPHLRERIFVVAHANGGGHDGDGRLTLAVTDSHESQDGILGADGEVADAPTVRRGRRQDDEGAQAAGRDGAETGGLADAANGSHKSSVTWSNVGRLQEALQRSSGYTDDWTVEPDVGRVAHGVPARVDRLRALGNAVVPQVAEVIGRALMAWQVSEALA